MINLKSNLAVKDKKSEIVKIPLKNLDNSINVLDNYFIKKKNNKIIWVADRICDHNFGKLIVNFKDDKNTAICPMHNWKLNLKNLNYINVNNKKKKLDFEIKDNNILIKNTEKIIEFPDETKSTNQDIEVRYLSHASVLIIYKGCKILTDPWFFGPAFSNGWWLKEPPTLDFKKIIDDVDIVYISHNHPDHLHIETLGYIKKNMQIITPKFKSGSTSKLLKRIGFKNIKLCEFNKVYSVNENFDFSILKSGDFKDDSGIFFNINNKKILLNVDSNNLNGGIVPKNIDLLLSSYAGGASGFPLCFENYSDDEKKRILLRNKNAQFTMVTNLINKTNCKIFMPYAGFFSESATRDKHIKKNNQKNKIDRLILFYKNKEHKPKIVDHQEFDTIRLSSQKKEIFLKQNIKQPLYKFDKKYVDKYIKKMKTNYKVSTENEKYTFEYFKNSNFKSNIYLFIILTDDNFNQNKYGFFVNFCKKNIIVSKSSSKNLFEKFKKKNNKSDINYLMIKVREDSFFNTIINKLPWEDLLIGFQCKINRKPNIYNNDFWYHFTNLYIDNVNFRFENPCNKCDRLLQSIY
jgi:CMP-N-acetylneuraminate monooxygenase